MASFFASPSFLSHPITRSNVLSSSQTQQPQILSQVQHLSANSVEEIAIVKSTDLFESTLTTRRFGIGAGLAWVGFLAVGSVSNQINNGLEVLHQEANTRDFEKQEEVVLPNGIRYYDTRIGGGATPRSGELMVINVKGSVKESGRVFVDTIGGDKKRSLALALGSRPYSKGICEGIECVLRNMKAGGVRRVIVPYIHGFGKEGADLGEGVVIPPFATLEYVIEVDRFLPLQQDIL